MDGLKPKENGGQEQSKNMDMLQCDKSENMFLSPVGGLHTAITVGLHPLQTHRCIDIFFRQQGRGHHCATLHNETLAEICSAKFQSDLRDLKWHVSLRDQGHCDVSVFQTDHI